MVIGVEREPWAFLFMVKRLFRREMEEAYYIFVGTWKLNE